MPGLKPSRHPDDFTLLRYTAGDLDETEQRRIEQHLVFCRICSAALVAIVKLDRELRSLAPELAASRELEGSDLFSRRPERAAARPAPPGDRRSFAQAALEASEEALSESGRLLAAARSSSESMESALAALDLSGAAARLALGYALKEAGLQIAEDPARAMVFGSAARRRVEGETGAGRGALEAEAILPLAALAGQADLLIGQAAIWAGALEKAGEHLALAYRAIGESTGDEVALATIELNESQRRSFDGRPGEALVLARRAAATFAEMDLEDSLARAKMAEGIALAKLEREEEAIEVFRGAADVFQAHKLWSNYVGAVNAVGASLMRLKRLEEARREYARALKSVSRERHAAWVPYIRNGLAHVLLSAGSHREAALGFARTARLFRDLDLPAHTLTASLFEIESWARCGDTGRARHRLELFRAEVARREALDPSIVRRIDAALSGDNPDFEELSLLRESASRMLAERFQKKLG